MSHGFHVAVDTADNNKVIAAACCNDRTKLAVNGYTVYPDASEGIIGEIPEDLVDSNLNPRYRWNGTGIELIA